MTTSEEKDCNEKRRIVKFLLPVILMVCSAMIYGAWLEYVGLETGIGVSKEPTIEIKSLLLNSRGNIITIIVDSTTRTIVSADPNPLRILINVTNIGPNPIGGLVTNDTLPKDWDPIQHPLIQHTQADGNTTLIDPAHFAVTYDSATRTLCISLSDIKTATGKLLDQNETVFITLSVMYTLIGEQLPPEYEDITLSYANIATAIAYFKSWQSQLVNSTLVFTTNINWI